MHTRKLGPRQEQRLAVALAVDDLLFRKHEHLMRQLHEAERRLAQKGIVQRVLMLRKDGNYEPLAILNVQISSDGACVIVADPRG